MLSAVALADLADRASFERVRFYILAQRAERPPLCNRGAATEFTTRAQQWETIRQRAARAFIARTTGRITQ